MTVPHSPAPTTVFLADIEIDRPALEARRHGRRLDISPQAVSLLLVLAERPGELVGREDLYAAMWPEGGVDVDRGLNTLIRQLRRGLGDSATDPRFIRTYPRRGYRLLVDPGEPPVPEPPAPRPESPVAGPIPRRTGGWLALAGLAAAAAILLGLTHGLPQRNAADSTTLSYRLGRYLLEQSSPSVRAQAVPHLAAAVDAHATAEVRAYYAEGLFWAGRLAEARSQIATALSADSGQSHALFIGGVLAHLIDWDPARARELMRRAIAGDGDRPEYRTGLAFLEATTGRSAQALMLVREAYRQDPVSTMLVADAGEIAMYAGDARSALAYCTVAADATAAPVAALQCAFEASLLLADTTIAAGFARAIAATAGGNPGLIPDSVGPSEAVVALRTRQAEQAAANIAAGRGSLFYGASFLAAAGRKQEALAALRRAIDQREPMAVTAAVHPRLSALRHEPAFVELLARSGPPG